LDGAGRSRLPFVEVEVEVAGEVEAVETGVLAADSVTVDLAGMAEDLVGTTEALEAQEVVEVLEIEAAEVVVDGDSAIVMEDEALVPTDAEAV
jgi:hypothetical protein